MYTLTYPANFEPLKFKRNGKESYEMILPTVLDLQHPFTFSASIAFDIHMADIAMELVQYTDNPADADVHGLPNYELIERTGPLVNL